MSRKVVQYLLSVLLLIILLWYSGLQLKILHEECAWEFIMKYFWVQWGVFVSIGILFGFLERFIYEFEKTGSWKVDIAKITIWGLPLLWVASSYLIYYSGITTGFISYIPFYMVSIELGPIVVAQVMLGYVIISSFYKKAN